MPREAALPVRRRVRLPVLYWTLGLLVVIVPALFAWRLYQVRSGAGAYLERADELAQERKWVAAADCLTIYLQLRPSDALAQIRLAEIYDRSATRPHEISRTAELYYKALSVAPADRVIGLRQRLAEVLLKLERYTSAITEAEAVLAAFPDDAIAARIVGLAFYGQIRSGEAKAIARPPSAVGLALEKAFQLNPRDLQVAVALARVWRRESALCSPQTATLPADKRDALADECLQSLVDASQSAQAYLLRYQYRLEFQVPGAASDLEQALVMAPQDSNVLMAAADQAKRDALLAGPNSPADPALLLDRAGAYYEDAIRHAPTEESAYLGLGETRLLQGKSDEAIAAWDRGLEKCSPFSISLNARKAAALITEGDTEGAAVCVEKIKSSTQQRRQTGRVERQDAYSRVADLLTAQIALARGEEDSAIGQLQRLARQHRSGAVGPSIAYQALMTLGELYLARGQWNDAATTFDSAAGLQPGALAPRLAAARAWNDADQADRSIAQYAQVLIAQPTLPNCLQLAAISLRTQQQRARAARDWSAVELALDRARRLNPNGAELLAWRLGLLEAEYLLLKHAAADESAAIAQTVLPMLKEKETDASDFPVQMAMLVATCERLGLAEEADRGNAALAKALPRAMITILTDVSLHLARKDFDSAEAALQSGLKTAQGGQRQTLQLELVNLLLEQGRENDAWESLAQACRDSGNDRVLIEKALDVAIATGRFQDAEKLEADFRNLPGVAAAEWQFYQATRLIAQSTSAGDRQLASAEQLQKEICQARRTWPLGYALLGEIRQRQGQLDAAVEAYQKALRLGEQRTNVIEELARLLYRMQRFDEADKCLASLQDRAMDSTQLAGLGIANAVRYGRMDRALAVAQRSAEQRPNDPTAQIWLAQILRASGKLEAAESALRNAISLDEGYPESFGALLDFLVHCERYDDIRQAVTQIEHAKRLPPAQRALLVAHAHDALGESDKALVAFREAVRLDPQSAQVHERLAACLLKTNPAAAEKAIRRALALNPRSTSARRMLATLLAQTGGTRGWDESQQILNSTEQGKPASAQDQRLRASLLVERRGQENLAAARQMILALQADPRTFAPNDYLLLAHIDEVEGDISAAHAQYLPLVDQGTPSLEHLAIFISFLLRQEKFEDAGKYLNKLDQLAPDDLTTIGLRARWMAATGRDKQIMPLLETAGEKLLQADAKASAAGVPSRRADICESIGHLYLIVDQPPTAEKWHRRAWEGDSRKFSELALVVAQQGRVSEAVKLCRDAAKNDESIYQAAITLCSLLAQAQASDEDFASAEIVLTEALAKRPNDVALLGAFANLRVVQKEPVEACALYRRALALQPQNVEMLNNLATVLAEQPQGQPEALEQIDKAIDLAGQQSALLDTKGTILLAAGKTREAVALLADAAAGPDSDPRYKFHLAVGYFRAGDMERARTALNLAHDRKLTEQILTDLDRQMLAELDERLP